MNEKLKHHWQLPQKSYGETFDEKWGFSYIVATLKLTKQYNADLLEIIH